MVLNQSNLILQNSGKPSSIALYRVSKSKEEQLTGEKKKQSIIVIIVALKY